MARITGETSERLRAFMPPDSGTSTSGASVPPRATAISSRITARFLHSLIIRSDGYTGRPCSAMTFANSLQSR
jgi:hypothetical protein